MKEIWPAIAVAGVTFAIPQFLVSNFHGPWLTDIIAAIVSMLCLILFLKIWHPKNDLGPSRDTRKCEQRAARADHGYSRAEVARAWLPWLVLSVFVFCWGTTHRQEDHEHAGKGLHLDEHAGQLRRARSPTRSSR